MAIVLRLENEREANFVKIDSTTHVRGGRIRRGIGSWATVVFHSGSVCGGVIYAQSRLR